MLQDEGNVLGHPVVDIARDPLALAEHRGGRQHVLQAPHLERAGHRKRQKNPSRSTSPV